MDAKVFRMALLTIFSAFILVAVIIYVTNADRINSLLGKREKASEEVSAEISAEEASIIYGQQIGNDLKSFLYDEDFFDENEKIPAVVVIKKNNNISSDASSLLLSEDENDENGRGMAVVGQLDNPDAAGSFDSGLQPPVLDPDKPIEGTPTGKPDMAGTPVGTIPSGN